MIPAAIQALLPQHPGEENHIGHSGAQVVMYEDCVLKVQPDTGNAANEGIMLRFLKGRLPVPESGAAAGSAFCRGFTSMCRSAGISTFPFWVMGMDGICTSCAGII